MKLRMSLVAACAAAILAFTTSAWADTVVSVAVTGHVYRVNGNWISAPTSVPGLGSNPGDLQTDENSFTASKIDFDTAGVPGTLATFLNHNGSATSTAGVLGLGDVMSNCSQSSGPPSFNTGCYSTLIRITSNSSFTFLAGATYTLGHDDGAVLQVGGSTISQFNQPGPQSLGTPASWTPGADVAGVFDLWYMATNLNPEILRLGVTPPPTTQVPEPASILLLGTVLVGLATIKRRRMHRS